MTSLSDLDNLYKTTVNKLSLADKLSYCNQRLDKAQDLLQKYINILDPFQKAQLRQIIQVTQEEIKQIMTEKNV